VSASHDVWDHVQEGGGEGWFAGRQQRRIFFSIAKFLEKSSRQSEENSRKSATKPLLKKKRGVFFVFFDFRIRPSGSGDGRSAYLFPRPKTGMVSQFLLMTHNMCRPLQCIRNDGIQAQVEGGGAINSDGSSDWCGERESE
jgi:hypothetical protein